MKAPLDDLLSVATLGGVHSDGQKEKSPHSVSGHRADGVSPAVLALAGRTSDHTQVRAVKG